MYDIYQHLNTGSYVPEVHKKTDIYYVMSVLVFSYGKGIFNTCPTFISFPEIPFAWRIFSIPAWEL